MKSDMHRKRHELLHPDKLVADFIARTGKLSGKTTVYGLMIWSREQTVTR